ncbi:hypothetical protein ADH76_31545 [Enterocloster clostridioformis]|nr:hypothetical protein A4V08_14165 [Lachnoclostridium sp. YL32]NDO26851.1 hypothetical protein [Enterocloster clostridioformis]OXE62374.1 hypothetical protein ADH76_31545 [Enterocloster clostridioformis]QQQ98513.1 hypothetical protein I5Q83_20435 [Enterocloster clostridioformis]
MRKKILLSSIIIIIAIVTMFFLIVRPFDNSKSDSWIGNYKFNEFAPPNQMMNYLITIYEDNGLYAHISIDGFSTVQRLTAKVWCHADEIWFTFYDYFVDEDGNTSIPEKYDRDNSLLKMRKEDGIIITEWEQIGPLLIENQEAGQYFTKDE